MSEDRHDSTRCDYAHKFHGRCTKGAGHEGAHLLNAPLSETMAAERPEPQGQIPEPSRCKHGVWKADLCYECEREATSCPSTLEERIRSLEAALTSCREERDTANFVLDAMKGLEKSKLACGHLSRYGYTEDGGKTGVCLLCELDRAEATLRDLRYDRALEAAMEPILEEYREHANQNDPAVPTGFARLCGANRIASAVRAVSAKAQTGAVMDQQTEQRVYAIVAALAGVAVEDITPECDIHALDFAQLEQQLQVVLNLVILPTAIEGAKTVAELIARLDEILYC